MEDPNYFDEHFTFEDFLNAVECLPDPIDSNINEKANEPVLSPKSPTAKRKTFGAQISEMRMEIDILREEIHLRDTQLVDMFYLLYNLITKENKK